MNFVFRRDELLIEEVSSVLPDIALCERIGLPEEILQPIWVLPDSPHRTVHVEPGVDAPQGYAFRKLRSLFGVLDDERMALAGRATRSRNGRAPTATAASAARRPSGCPPNSACVARPAASRPTRASRPR